MSRKQRFIVVKGRNTIPGVAGVNYHIFDNVSFDTNVDTLYNLMQSYVYNKLQTVDYKTNHTENFDQDVTPRKRHILLHDESIFADSIQLFDHPDGTFYGFIPIESFK